MSRKPRRTPEQIKADNDAKALAKQRNKLAKFVVQKYVVKSQINWARDIKIAQTMVEKFPADKFWEQLECRFQVKALSGLMTEKAQAFLSREWLKFRVVIPPKVEYKLEPDKVDEDRTYEPRKPKSILEFCKYA